MTETTNKLLHIICLPVTGVGLHGGYRSDSWFKHRLNIFRNYTLKSLANQSNKNFLLWLWMRPEEEKNPITKDWIKALDESRLAYIITYHGLAYRDDKFVHYTLRVKLRNLLMMLRDCFHYKQWHGFKTIWKYTWENKNETLLVRLTQALKEVKEIIGSEFDWVYLTRLDSDDMLHCEAVNLIQSQPPEVRRSLCFDAGFLYNVDTGQLAEWKPPTNPPFHTIIFPGYTFFDAVSHKEYYRDFKSHEDATRVFNPVKLDIGKFCVTYHGRHISTAWESPLLKKAYHAVKYGTTEPFKGREIKGFIQTVSGQNISTRWVNRMTKVKNPMIGKEYDNDSKKAILSDFGL